MMKALAASSHTAVAAAAAVTNGGAQAPAEPKLGAMGDAVLTAELEQYIEDTDPALAAEREDMQRAAASLRVALAFKVDGCVITKAEKEFSAQLQVISLDCVFCGCRTLLATLSLSTLPLSTLPLTVISAARTWKLVA